MFTKEVNGQTTKEQKRGSGVYHPIKTILDLYTMAVSAAHDPMTFAKGITRA